MRGFRRILGRREFVNRFLGPRQQLHSHTYDLVVLDIMGVAGFVLLEIVVLHGFPAVMLTAHALNPDSLKKSIELGAASAYLPKEKLESVVPFLEDVIN